MVSAAAIFMVALLSPALAEQANPIGKVIQLLSDLEAKIVDEGAAAQKRYDEFTEMCEERSANLAYEIKSAKGEKADLKAVIGQEAARVGSLT